MPEPEQDKFIWIVAIQRINPKIDDTEIDVQTIDFDTEAEAIEYCEYITYTYKERRHVYMLKLPFSERGEFLH